MKYEDNDIAIIIFKNIIAQLRKEKDLANKKLAFIESEILRYLSLIDQIEELAREEETPQPRNPWDKYRLDSYLYMRDSRDRYKNMLSDLYKDLLNIDFTIDSNNFYHKFKNFDFNKFQSKMNELTKMFNNEENNNKDGSHE